MTDAMPPARRIGVVVPMRNESLAVAPLFEKFAELIEASPDRYRVVVVDGASSDGTPDLVRGYAGRIPIEIIRTSEGSGLGDALETGLVAILDQTDAIVTMDGDDSHDPRSIPELLARLEEGFDVVVASRFAPGGREVGVAPHRRLLSHVASGLLTALFPVAGVRDYSSGYRAYRPAALRALAERGRIVEERDFACMLELLLKLRRQGARGAEVPLVLRYDQKRSASKMNVGKTVVRYLVLIGRYLGGRG